MTIFNTLTKLRDVPDPQDVVLSQNNDKSLLHWTLEMYCTYSSSSVPLFHSSGILTHTFVLTRKRGAYGPPHSSTCSGLGGPFRQGYTNDRICPKSIMYIYDSICSVKLTGLNKWQYKLKTVKIKSMAVFIFKTDTKYYFSGWTEN